MFRLPVISMSTAWPQFAEMLDDLQKVANVIQRFCRFYFKLGITRHIELLTGAVFIPEFFPLQAYAAFSCIHFHQFRRAGIEYQAGGKNHAYGFFAAVREQYRVRHAFAVKIDVGLFNDAYLVELCSHMIGVKKARMAGMRAGVLKVRRKLLTAFCAGIRCDTHAQRIQLDKAAGVGLVVGAAVFVEGRDIHVEQRICFGVA